MSGDDGHRNPLRLAASGPDPIIGTVTDQRVEKWVRWIDGPIRNEVLRMHLQRHVWREMAAGIEGRELPESYWWQFMFDTYMATQVMAVRRQADTHKDVASLAKLIEEIRDEPRPLLTRDHWVGLWTIPPDDRGEVEYARRQWDSTFGTGEDQRRLDPRLPAADFEALVAAAAGAQRYADQHVAHSQANRAPAGITLTLADVHEAIGAIGDLFRRYYSLLMAAEYTDLTPVIQHDWTALLRVPWLEPRKPRRRPG